MEDKAHVQPAPSEVVCDRCGRSGAFVFDGCTLCEDCYEAFGSCCVEFGAEDLWKGPASTVLSSDTPKSDPE